MRDLIECRRCDSPHCEGCNLYILAAMLHTGKFDGLMNEHHSIIQTEVEPVKHGRWVQVICHDEYEDGFVDRVKECCSVCHAQNWRRTTNYCPNCGAKMDLKGE